MADADTSLGLRALARNAGALLSGNVLAALFAVGSVAIAARALGATDLGVLVLVSGYALSVGVLLNFQSWHMVVRYGAIAHGAADHQKLADILKLGFVLDLVSAVLATALGYLAVPYIASWLGWDPTTMRYAGLYCITILFNLGGMPIGLLRVLGRFKLQAAHTAITAGVKLVGCGLLWRDGGDLHDFLLLWMAVQVLSGISLFVLGVALARRELKVSWLKGRVRGNGEPVRFALWSNLASSVDLPVKQLDIVIVSAVMSLEQVAAYRIIKQAAGVAGKLTDPVYQAILPPLSQQAADGDGRDALRLSARAGALLFAIMLLPLFAVTLTAPWWLALVFGPEFAPYWLELGVYLLFTGLAVAVLPVHPLVLALGYARATVVIAVVGNLGFLLGVYLMGRPLELLGVSLSFGVAVLVVSIAKSFIVWRHYRRT